ncbi:alpha/beta hydrolase [Streptomyces sp. NPDC059506]|uniref:alpha/beta hydrolase n=1 Tax=Streptomyces sp. NPDC059506 TaxID=3347751 RepID=UPI003679FD95
MRRHAAAAVALATAAAGLLVPGAPPAAAGAAPAGAPPQDRARAAAPAGTGRISWRECGTDKQPTLQCGTLGGPLDHARPDGERITLALSRVPHTAKTFQGPLLVNPGGPGGSGLDLAGFVAGSLPEEVAAQYDVVGFDPRGVGRSEPSLDCAPRHFAPVRPDPVPRNRAEETANLQRVRSFAAACGAKHGRTLRHVDTVSTARDMDLLRAALGAERVNYLGYSYGTYLGAVYARLFPERVRRLVFDSIVDPEAVWYDANLEQNHAFDARHKAFAAWVAEHDAVYRLGTDPARVEARWYEMREAVRARPAGGRVGPGELEDTFAHGGYYDGHWPDLAAGFAAWANEGDEGPLVGLYDSLAAVDAAGDNGFSVYAAVGCRDARWPRSWSAWRADARKAHAKSPFLTWNNTWYNAQCAFWPAPSLTPPDVENHRIPPALLLQAGEDAATPYRGAAAMHRLLGRSRLVVEDGGANHGVSFSGNACMDRYLVDYLADGRLPRAKAGPDAVCDAPPPPAPRRPGKGGSTGDRGDGPVTGGRGAALHRLIAPRP